MVGVLFWRCSVFSAYRPVYTGVVGGLDPTDTFYLDIPYLDTYFWIHFDTFFFGLDMIFFF